MKLTVTILLAVCVAIHGYAINNEETDNSITGKVIVPNSLFESAWEYQRRLETLQNLINERLTEVRTAVSSVLKSTSAKTLEQIETNANNILDLDRPVRQRIFVELSSTQCVNNLRTIINGVTEFTGFASSNCVSSYDKSVQGVLKVAYDLLQHYEGSTVDVQQTVVKSFIGKNAFLEPDAIEARFVELYNERLNEWNEINPNVEDFVEVLRGNIAGFNGVLHNCFNDIEEYVSSSYVALEESIRTCEEFDNTTDPFAIYRR